MVMASKYCKIGEIETELMKSWFGKKANIGIQRMMSG